jgi:hypothetical protein
LKSGSRRRFGKTSENLPVFFRASGNLPVFFRAASWLTIRRIAEYRQRSRKRCAMTNITNTRRDPSKGNLLIGAKAIGIALDPENPVPPSKVYSLNAAHAFGDAVFKAGHRTLIGNRRKLLALGFGNVA